MSTGDAHVIQHYNSESTVRKTVVLAKRYVYFYFEKKVFVVL